MLTLAIPKWAVLYPLVIMAAVCAVTAGAMLARRALDRAGIIILREARHD
jgi:hypothetical protein